MCATLFLFATSFGVCTKTEIVALSELKNPPLCNKFHCFLFRMVCYEQVCFERGTRLDSEQLSLVFLVNELFMS